MGARLGPVRGPSQSKVFEDHVRNCRVHGAEDEDDESTLVVC